MLSLNRRTRGGAQRGGLTTLIATIASLALFTVALPTSALADEAAPEEVTVTSPEAAQPDPLPAEEQAPPAEKVVPPAEDAEELAPPPEEQGEVEVIPPPAEEETPAPVESAEEVLSDEAGLEETGPDETGLAEAATPAATLRVAPAAVVTAPDWNDKIAICHSTASESNPYVFIRPSVRSIISDDEGDPSKAHSVHHNFGDIIPAFDYLDSEGALQHFDGLNLDLLGMLDEEGKDCGTLPPVIDLVVDQCTTPGGELPPIGVILSELLPGYEYTVSVTDGDVEIGSHTFTPADTTFQWDFTVPTAGYYEVFVHRSGDEEGAQDVSAVTYVDPCPPVRDVDLVLEKSAMGGPVSSLGGGLIDYTVVVWNDGEDATLDPIVTDTLPGGVTVAGLVTVVTSPPGNEAGWSVDTSVPGFITASYDGWFGPEDTATFSFQGLVGALEQADPMVPIADLVNVACVESFRYDITDWPEVERVSDQSEEWEGVLLPEVETNAENNCDDASTPVFTPVTPVVPPATVTPAALAKTGSEAGWMLPLAASTILLGLFALMLSGRRRHDGGRQH